MIVPNLVVEGARLAGGLNHILHPRRDFGAAFMRVISWLRHRIECGRSRTRPESAFCALKREKAGAVASLRENSARMRPVQAFGAALAALALVSERSAMRADLPRRSRK